MGFNDNPAIKGKFRWELKSVGQVPIVKALVGVTWNCALRLRLAEADSDEEPLKVQIRPGQ